MSASEAAATRTALDTEMKSALRIAKEARDALDKAISHLENVRGSTRVCRNYLSGASNLAHEAARHAETAYRLKQAILGGAN